MLEINTKKKCKACFAKKCTKPKYALKNVQSLFDEKTVGSKIDTIATKADIAYRMINATHERWDIIEMHAIYAFLAMRDSYAGKAITVWLGCYTNKTDKEIYATKADKVCYASKAAKVSYASKADNVSYASKAEKVSYVSKADKVSYASKADKVSYASKADKVSYASKADKVSYASKVCIAVLNSDGYTDRYTSTAEIASLERMAT